MLKKQLKIWSKALEAAADKVGSEIGTRAVNKVISVVDKKFSKPPKEVKTIIYKEGESDDEEWSKPLVINDSKEPSKPLGNIIMKELNKKSDNLLSPENLNAALKTQYYCYHVNNFKVN